MAKPRVLALRGQPDSHFWPLPSRLRANFVAARLPGTEVTSNTLEIRGMSAKIADYLRLAGVGWIEFGLGEAPRDARSRPPGRESGVCRRKSHAARF